MSISAQSSRKFDFVKWMVVFLLFAGGLAANYYYSSIDLPIRIIAWIFIFSLMLLMAAWTDKGRAALKFIGEARNELRRVVWPTKQETIQMTSIVVVMVVVAGLILWGLDARSERAHV
jgi:preprotein translocase subunit SecE